MNKIIELDNGHIGMVGDIRKAYREEISHQALNYDLDEEEMQYNINLILDLLVNIQNLEEDILIKVVYNPMGAYQYIIYTEERLDELERQIKYLEDKMQNCACSKDDLYELENLKQELNKLESRYDDDK